MLPEAQALERNITPLRGTDIRLGGNSTLYQSSGFSTRVPEKTLTASQPVPTDVFSPAIGQGAVVALPIPHAYFPEE
jgi:hypothetical protein